MVDMPDSSMKRKKRLRRLRTVPIAPALMTLGNLLCGFAAIFFATRSMSQEVLGHFDPLTVATSLVFAAMIFDALDGSVARITRQTSSFGAQLDSMADMVSFGVAPAFLLIQIAGVGAPFFGSGRLDTYYDRVILLIAGAYAACCALRLARFNIEVVDSGEGAHRYFSGLPSPGAAGTVAALILLYQQLPGDVFYEGTAETTPDDPSVAAGVFAITMAAITLVAALAMISRLRYTHVINYYFRGRGTFNYVATLVLALILVLTVPEWAIAGGFVAYALSGPTTAFTRWWWNLARGDEDAEVEEIDDAAEEDEVEPAESSPPLQLRREEG